MVSEPRLIGELVRELVEDQLGAAIERWFEAANAVDVPGDLAGEEKFDEALVTDRGETKGGRMG